VQYLFQTRSSPPPLAAQDLHGLKVSAAREPGVIMDVSVDANGDLDRESFMVEARNGKQEIKEILPALGAR
jgi:branched-chain amino acid transport system substrate-binding protein